MVDSESIVTIILVAYLVYLCISVFIWPTYQDRILAFMEENGLRKVSTTSSVTHNITVLDDPTPTRVDDAQLAQDIQSIQLVDGETDPSLMVPSNSQVAASNLKTISERAAETSLERDNHIVLKYNPVTKTASIKNPWQDEINANSLSKPDEYIKLN